MPSAVIIGGGVGGLSAAHELIDRGFDVTVFEKRGIAGGKARSMDVANSATAGRRPLPGEHGFRFFPSYYKHLPDTMSRIPFEGGVVLDNLVKAPEGLFARVGGPNAEIVTFLPRSPKQMGMMIRALFEGLDLTDDDLSFFCGRLWRFLTSCGGRRLNEYEPLPWTEFVRAEGRSKSYRTVFTGLTQTFVAMASDLASTRTVGDVVVQLLLGGMELTASDRVLNGPTNEVWIDPWVRHLKSRGVQYVADAGVEAIDCTNEVITGVRVDGASSTKSVQADVYIAAVPVDAMARLASDEILDADPTFKSICKLNASSTGWMNGIQFYLKEETPIVEGHALYLKAPWGLTSISQKQFWKQRFGQPGDGTVKDVLSVDICDWDAKGVVEHRGQLRAARDCTRNEIEADVWAQLKSCLNVGSDKDGRPIAVLRDEMIHSSHLDPGVTLEAEGEGPSANAEPMLLNQAGTWLMRPTAYTQIPNLFLAADYVQTHTDLATMEGANEAARRAVNAILETQNVRRGRCGVWRLHEPALLAPWRLHDAMRFRRGLPWADPLGHTLRTIEVGVSQVVGVLRRLIGR